MYIFSPLVFYIIHHKLNDLITSLVTNTLIPQGLASVTHTKRQSSEKGGSGMRKTKTKKKGDANKTGGYKLQCLLAC